MYTTLLYFIVAFTVYGLYELPASSRWTERDIAVAVVAGMCMLYGVAVMIFGRMSSRYVQGVYGTEAFSTVHGRYMNWCTVGAIGIFAVYIHVFDLPYYVATAFAPCTSALLSALVHSALFCFLLVLIWNAAYPSYRRLYHAEAKRSAYIGSHLRVAVSIMVPWFLYHGFFDAISLLPESARLLFEEHPVVQYGSMVIVAVAVAIAYPRVLVRLWHCTPLPHGLLRSRLEAFCRAAGFRFTDILLWDLFDGKLITAGVLGFVPYAQYILISPTLVRLLEPEELEAVMAHEIGHVRHRHLLWYGAFVLGYGLIVYAFWTLLTRIAVSWDAVLDMVITSEGRIAPFASFAVGVISIVLLLGYFRGVFGVFSRNFERQADGYAVVLTGSGAGIASSLEKIAGASALSRTASNWHHFGIQERIDYVMRCTTHPALIHHHDRRVRRMVSLYAAALGIVAGVVFGMQGQMSGDVQMSIVQKVVEKKVAADPDNASLLLLLANIYYELKHYGAAEEYYLKVLGLEPDNAEALNNLAWLYATAQDERFYNPKEALRLATRAAELDPQPHILDTLAESFFINGDCDSAVETINVALQQHPKDIAYYTRQLKKFERCQHTTRDRHAPKKLPDDSISL
ncbi:MAG: M48 family metalloprotease [Desulfobacterota bacterium]|nr:M48 family metalloprotease [Thermodesulfobacteriota bacterium]